jgi:hypothetical protein
MEKFPMKALARYIAVALVALMIGPALFAPSVSAREYSTLSMRTFTDGNSGILMQFPQAGKQTATVNMDVDSVVFNASVDVSPFPYTPGGLDYPTDPYIDIGADGTKEWGYSGIGYGRWGLQDVFNDNSTEITLNYQNENDTRDLRFKLPKGAQILGGSFTTGGWPEAYWGPDYVISNPSTKSKGESSPVLLPFGNKLFEFWVSEDPTYTNNTNSDIIYKYYDGHTWSKAYDLSPPHDIMWDDSPNVVIYNGKLYCAWSAAESKDFFALDDIYLRSTDDGITWSSIKKITPLVRSGMNDWPWMVVFQGKLYIVWKTTDPNISDHSNDNDFDLVLRWYDGANLGPIDEITKNDDGAMDWSFSVAVYNNRLYIVWETDVGGWITSQVDIVVKSFDGVSWSNRKTLSPSNDDTKDEIPGTYVWYNPVKQQNELWVIWGRGDGNPDNTGDINIVVRSYDGVTWTPMKEISYPDVQVQNMGQVLIGYENRLYAIWIDGTESVIVDQSPTLIVFKIYGNIDIRSFDGYEWSAIKELTPEGITNKASDPYITVYNGKLYATWSYPNDASTSSDDWDIILRNIDFQDVTLSLDVGNKGSVDWNGVVNSSQQVIPLNKTQIEGAMTGGSITDQYGNEITEVDIKVTSRYPAKLLAHDLKIEYKYPKYFDFKDDLNKVLTSLRPSVNDSRQMPLNQTVDYRFEAGSSSEGDIAFDNLRIDYILNHAPFLVKEIPAQYMLEDTDKLDALDLEEYFSDDWDDGNLQFKIMSTDDPNLVGIVLNGSKLGFTTPTENWNGQSNVTVAAYDGFGLRSPRVKIHIFVMPVNDPPILDPIPDQLLKSGDKFKYKCSAHDVDIGEKLTFHTNSTIIRIDPDTGQISFIPNKRGIFKFNVSVDDGNGLWASQDVTYTIRGETTSSGTGTCFSLLAVVVLGLVIFLLAWKFRHEFAWHPVAPERLRVGKGKGPKGKEVEAQTIPGTTSGSDMPDDSVVDMPTLDMEDLDAETKAEKPQKNKEGLAVLPGTDIPMNEYDTNKDGFLDDNEWTKAVEDIKSRKKSNLTDLKAKARRIAKKKVDVEQEAPEEEPPAQVPSEEVPIFDMTEVRPVVPKLDEYLPPGERRARGL